ncbi:MAG TPA: hypothetical protein VJP07_07345 [Dehalococcoidia bacterium]|nr:hypothetical protein [Dehalococcoidia bacterium]
MYTENGLLVDLGQIDQIIKDADVFAVGYQLFPERMLIDTRHDASDPDGPCGLPMVAIVDPVATVQERFFWLGQHRPSLGMPQSFMFFHWPHSIRYLEESGVWERIRARIVYSGFDGAAETCDAALQDLYRREHAATVDAIRGERYQTLWAANEV